MAKKPPVVPMDIAQELVADLKAALGDDLVSVTIFGSAAGPRYKKGKSDINLLLVLADGSARRPSELFKFCAAWAGAGVSPPLWMTPDYLKSSADVFPIELLVMAAEHQVLMGPDPFEGQSLDAGHLRLQLEREMKGKLTTLRTRLLAGGGKRAALRQLVYEALPAFSALCQAWLHLKSQEPPSDLSQVLQAAGQAGFETGALEILSGMRSGKKWVRDQELLQIWEKAVTDLEHNSHLVDRLEV